MGTSQMEIGSDKEGVRSTQRASRSGQGQRVGQDRGVTKEQMS